MSDDLGVTLEHVKASYEDVITSDREEWVKTKIEEATNELLGLIPSLPGRISRGSIKPNLVRDKVVAAVLRVVRNPKGIDTEGEGDYNIKLRNTVASGDIWYPEKDLIQLGWELPDKRAMPRTVRARATPGWGFPG